ncbi:MAG: sensor histidine kinase [Candidatus Hodarchaeales archaeon]
MEGMFLFVFHILTYSFFGYLTLKVRDRFSYIPFYLYLGILQVFISLLSSIYVIKLGTLFGETIEVGGGNIIYAAIVWCVMLYYLVDRDPSTIRILIFSLILVQGVFLVIYPLFVLVLECSDIINPLQIPSELFTTSLGIFLVGNILLLIELISMIYLIEKSNGKYVFIPLQIRVALIFTGTLLLDGILFPVFAFPVTRSISVVVGFSSIINKILLAIFYNLTLILSVHLLKIKFDSSNNDIDIRLKDLFILPKVKVIEEYRSLEEKQRMIRTLLDLLSHDIRNYNQSTILILETFANLGKLTSDERQLLEKAIQIQLDSASLVGTVLYLNKMQEGLLIAEEVPLDEYFHKSVKKVSNSFPSIELVIENLEVIDGVTVILHPLLEEIFYNLLSNSIKYRKQDQPLVKIRLSLKKSRKKVHLIIEDQGLGIPDPMKKEIFSVGSKTKYQSGIGLSVVARLLELFDSKIWVENLPDSPDDYSAGSAFHLVFPAP